MNCKPERAASITLKRGTVCVTVNIHKDVAQPSAVFKSASVFSGPLKKVIWEKSDLFWGFFDLMVCLGNRCFWTFDSMADIER